MRYTLLPHECELHRWRKPCVRPFDVLRFIIWQFDCAHRALHLWAIMSVRKGRAMKVSVSSVKQCRHPWTTMRWASLGSESLSIALQLRELVLLRMGEGRRTSLLWCHTALTWPLLVGSELVMVHDAVSE